MWWLLWVGVVGVVATAMLIAYLVDRRGPTGVGMTDRDRGQAAGITRDHETRADPWGHLGAGGSP